MCKAGILHCHVFFLNQVISKVEWLYFVGPAMELGQVTAIGSWEALTTGTKSRCSQQTGALRKSGFTAGSCGPSRPSHLWQCHCFSYGFLKPKTICSEVPNSLGVSCLGTGYFSTWSFNNGWLIDLVLNGLVSDKVPHDSRLDTPFSVANILDKPRFKKWPSATGTIYIYIICIYIIYMILPLQPP